MPRKCKSDFICISNVNLLFFIIIILGGYLFYITNPRFSSENSKSKEVVHVNQNRNSSLERNNTLMSNFFPMGFTNLSSDVLIDPYVAPLRDARVFPINSSDIRGIPINIRTQGYNTNYRQVGILTRNGGQETMLPLMGRPLMANRDKWQFYTINDKFNGIKLPVVSKGKSCTNEYGCDDLMNGEDVYIQGYKDTFKVTMYDTNLPEYIPYI